MGDTSGNIYFSGGSSRIGHSRQPSSPDEQNILPHLLTPLPCEAHFQPYLGAGGNAQNISVQFMHSCSGQDTTQLDSDILQRRLNIDEDSPSMSVHPIGYPESSQRTTSHALSPYANDVSRFGDFASCDLATLHLVDAPLHGQVLRRGSWPSHSQMGHSPWTQSPPRMVRSPASEPPESTSDESFQDSDTEEATHMSPMMNQFQIQSSRIVDFSPHHMYCTQALQPSVMTFQLSERMLQPVDDPENRHMLRSLMDMNIVADDASGIMHPSPSLILPASTPPSFGGAMYQGSGMRLQHDNEQVIKTNQFRVPPSPSNTIPSPSTHNPAHTSTRGGDQRPPSTKQQKKSKMHRCEKCGKLFPRPSGLATHMNTHSGAKPYKCIVPNCEKSFAVRSNAKRHLRTHGVHPVSPDVLSRPHFTVGFEEPMVTQVQDAGKQPLRYRWIPQNQSPHEGAWPPQGSPSSASSATGLTFQASMSSTTSTALSNGSDDDCDEVAPSSSVDLHQCPGEYSKGSDGLPSPYPNYGGRSQ